MKGKNGKARQRTEPTTNLSSGAENLVSDEGDGPLVDGLEDGLDAAVYVDLF